MILARTSNLGLIPAWQFSTDPTVNPKINPHLPLAGFSSTVAIANVVGYAALAGVLGFAGFLTYRYLAPKRRRR